MNLLRRLFGQCPAQTSPKESYEERVRRITKHELLQSSYSQPDLIENLLLAADSGSISNTTTSPSMDLILNMAQFEKKKNWLFPWGPELIDETYRPCNTDYPTYLMRKELEYHRQLSEVYRSLSADEIRLLLSDPSQHWDRILLEDFDPAFFDVLHLHPCEELRFDPTSRGCHPRACRIRSGAHKQRSRERGADGSLPSVLGVHRFALGSAKGTSIWLDPASTCSGEAFRHFVHSFFDG